MRKIIASIILTIIIIGAGYAVDQSSAELNNIYIFYNQQNYAAAEQNLINLLYNNPNQHFTYALELGDFYLDKTNDYPKTESIYQSLVEKYPKQKNIGDIYYRLGVCYEKQEKYLEAAQMYEMVATKYRQSQYAQDGLDAIERCFKKNYQDYVAKVNGYPITRIEFDDRLLQNPGAYEKFEDRQKLLDNMINDRIMYKEALNRGLDQTADFKNRINDIRKNIMFNQWYQKEVINQVKITEKDKKAYFKKNKKEFVIPEQASAREILVRTKQEADSLYTLITTYNLPFDSVASETSLAPTKSAGGDLGLFRRGTHPEEMENVIFKLKPKQISKPFYSETKGGYMIVKLEEYRPKKDRPYQDVSNEIENRLRNEQTEKTFKTKTDAFKKASIVTVDEQALRENRDTLALVDGEVITQQAINDIIATVPPFYRTELETPEGKKRILDDLVMQKTWLKQLEKDKFWLLNSVFSQLDATKNQLLISDLRKNEVADKINISETELQQEYKKNLAEYKTPKQIRAREITVASESLAQAVRNVAVNDKIAFDSLARQYSTASDKWMGGDMGFFSAGSKPKEIEAVAFKLNKGQISKVIKQNDSTFTVIKVEEIKDASTKSFDDVKRTLQNKMRQQKDQELFSNFISETQRPYQIEIFLTDETPQPEPENPKPEPSEENK